MNSDLDILRHFIDDEAASLETGQQGQFYPSNHHVLLPLVSRAPRLLSSAVERGDLYFWLLRLDVCPKIVDDGEVRIVDAAYERILPLFTAGYPACHLERMRGLFVFGRDDRSRLPDEGGLTLARYQRHVAIWRYLTSFSNIPGMLKKPERFAELARDVEVLARVRHVLGRLQFDDDLSGPVCLWFWALVFIALQDDDAATDVVAKITGEPVPHQLASMPSILDRYLLAAGRST